MFVFSCLYCIFPRIIKSTATTATCIFKHENLCMYILQSLTKNMNNNIKNDSNFAINKINFYNYKSIFLGLFQCAVNVSINLRKFKEKRNNALSSCLLQCLHERFLL